MYLKERCIFQFHNTLLCMIAYPGNKELLALTEKTVSLLLEQLTKLQSLQNNLIGTGLLHTSIECNFTCQK